MKIAALVRGLPGHPLHPPMTDGAYAAATVLVVAGAAGVAEKERVEAG